MDRLPRARQTLLEPPGFHSVQSEMSSPQVVYESVSTAFPPRFHKDNLRHLSRFSDLFVTLRILSAPPKTRESAKVHKQTNLSENRGVNGVNLRGDLRARRPTIPAESLKSRYPSPGHPSRLEGLVWIRLGFSSDFPQELGLYA